VIVELGIEGGLREVEGTNALFLAVSVTERGDFWWG
jgi:hypothetical protein